MFRPKLIIGFCFAPMLSLIYFLRAMTMTLGAFINEAEIEITAEEVTNTLPGHAMIRKLLRKY